MYDLMEQTIPETIHATLPTGGGTHMDGLGMYDLFQETIPNTMQALYQPTIHSGIGGLGVSLPGAVAYGNGTTSAKGGGPNAPGIKGLSVSFEEALMNPEFGYGSGGNLYGLGEIKAKPVNLGLLVGSGLVMSALSKKDRVGGFLWGAAGAYLLQWAVDYSEAAKGVRP